MIGIIGGSGLYDLDGLTQRREEIVNTPFGPASDALMFGELDGVELVFLSRHGRGHVHSPSSVPYRANIWAMRSVGVRWLLSVSAVGSLREEIVPGHVVIPDQLIDRTRGRSASFFEEGLVAHIGFGDPYSEELRRLLILACEEAGATTHTRGTYLAMEGPAFSTRAESNLYRRWGADIIGMTNVPEAKLAREAEIAYATLALSTDYDCWHPDHDSVTVDMVIDILMKNVSLAKKVIAKVAPKVAVFQGSAAAHHSLKNSIITNPDRIDPAMKAKLALFTQEYLG